MQQVQVTNKPVLWLSCCNLEIGDFAMNLVYILHSSGISSLSSQKKKKKIVKSGKCHSSFFFDYLDGTSLTTYCFKLHFCTVPCSVSNNMQTACILVRGSSQEVN